MSMAVSIVVPVYNEQHAVRHTAESLQAVAAALGPDAAIVLVDDGSTDGSGLVLDGLEGVQVRRHAANRGYGAALKTGIAATDSEWVVITDADGTYPHESIPALLARARAEQLDMVVGSRTGANAHVPWPRRPAKAFITWLGSYLCEQEIPDLNSGLRVLRRSALEPYLDILPDSFSFTTTITLAMLANGHPVAYAPIDYHPRTGRSKIRPLRDTLLFIQLIIRMVMYFNPLRVFMPASLLLFAASIAALIYRMVRGSGLAAVSVILFIAGVQVLTTGMIADLIDRRFRLARKH